MLIHTDGSLEGRRCWTDDYGLPCLARPASLMHCVGLVVCRAFRTGFACRAARELLEPTRYNHRAKILARLVKKLQRAGYDPRELTSYELFIQP